MSLIPRNSLFDVDNLFERMWGGNFPMIENAGSAFTPRVDVHERDKNYEISAELPGVDKKDLHVTYDDGVLTIEAETREERKEEKEGKVIRQERRYGKFMRSFNLGHGIKESDIKANFSNGILTLTVPKSMEENAPRREITVN